MIKEIAITIETAVVREAGDYFVRVAYEGKQRLTFGPLEDRFTAHDLAEVISKSARSAIEFFLETQQFPLKVPA